MVWTTKGIYIERILPDAQFWASTIQSAEAFFKVGVFPELAAHWYSRPTVAEVITTTTSVGEIYLCLVAPEDVRNPSAASLLGHLTRPLTLGCDPFWNPKKTAIPILACEIIRTNVHSTTGRHY